MQAEKSVSQLPTEESFLYRRCAGAACSRSSMTVPTDRFSGRRLYTAPLLLIGFFIEQNPSSSAISYHFKSHKFICRPEGLPLDKVYPIIYTIVS